MNWEWYWAEACCERMADCYESHWLVGSLLFFLLIFVPLLVIEWVDGRLRRDA